MVKRISRNVVTTSAVVMALGLSAGCASTQRIDEVRAAAEDAQRAATQAGERAAVAERKADEAKSAADAAMRKAQEAERCCEETNEKIDRMFKKSMSK